MPAFMLNMKLFSNLKEFLMQNKHHLKDNKFNSILRLIDIFPSLLGFSLLKNTFFIPFWILHISLLVYVYGVGCVVYQIKVAEGARDFIKSYVNISILILTVNNTYWFVMKRSLLKEVLDQVKRQDQLTTKTESLRKKYGKLLSVIKKILFIFYGFNLFDCFFIYVPLRLDVTNDYYSMTRCVGMGSLSNTPNREICQMILFAQEFTLITVVLSYQAYLLFLIAYTTITYEMLSAEMLALDEYKDTPENRILIKERLPFLIQRHALTLDIIKNLKDLYSMPIGVNFGSNAVCICLFFYLPLQEWITFAPVLIYCFITFFLYCFLCQRLINASEDFENAIYGCGWEKFNMREKKTVYVMLMQAQKPITLLAADIIPVNIYTFATTLQAMYKFITIVKF